MPSRGFQSSTAYTMTIGLGKNKQVDSLMIRYPNSNVYKTTTVAVDTLLVFDQKDAVVGVSTYF